MDNIKAQIREALRIYPGNDPQAALLSGMSLAAAFLAKNDGHQTITANNVLQAAYEVGEELGYMIGKLKPTEPSE